MKVLEDIVPFGVKGEVSRGILNLELSDDLAEYTVFDVSGRNVARVYGCLLHDWAGKGIRFSNRTMNLEFDVVSIETIEELVANLNGSFLLESLAPLPHRLYSDAGGTIPVVYCAESGRIASSAGMMMGPEEYAERFLRGRFERLIENDIAGAWIPGFLTAHAGLERLLPNFCLDLATWQAHRYWPRREDIDVEIDMEDAAQRVASCLRGYVNATAAQFGRIAPTLTAGSDTRIILAACRDIPGSCEFVTTGAANQGIDQIVSAEIAAKLGLSHRLLPPIRATREEMARWDRLVGHCTREASRDYHPTLAGVGADVMFTGMYGETGRARLYKKELDRINDVTPDAQFIAGRISTPTNDREVLETLERWLGTINSAPTWKVLDLAFNELRFGGWAMAQAPAQRGIQFSLMPFAQRSVQAAFMNVRPSEKTTTRLFSRIGTILWPEAMEMPINRYGDYRDRLTFLKKFTKRDHLMRGWRLLRTRLR